jgi:hypothetical protein
VCGNDHSSIKVQASKANKDFKREPFQQQILATFVTTTSVLFLEERSANGQQNHKTYHAQE